MNSVAVREKSSQNADSFRVLRDEKNRRFVSCSDKEIK
jgi:hypothetical protein